ncbi:MAG TPA: penicillin-binding transpeptidase domain-containing protein [Egicoccus sp.]|nr:penicillin-binding transpeptidase domain-containing protein [Egicoccus sp.]HSK24708.1 penicillin-binding transpeptidase domain-containing protein [Egicoccus sp.]
MKDLLIAIVALCALAGAAYGGWWLLTESDVFTGEQEEVADPADTAASFAAAWEAGDLDEMLALTRDEPSTMRPAYEQLVEGLAPDQVRVVPGDVEQIGDGRAAAPMAVTLVGGEYGEVGWEVEVELQRARGDWMVVWSPSSLHPSYREGMTFEIEREDLDRAPILAAGGEQLAGEGELVTLGFEPAGVEDPELLAERFEEIVPGTGETVERTYARGGLVDGWFYPITTLPAALADDAWNELRSVDGTLRRSGSGRSLYDVGFAQHVVGRVDEATAEQLERLGPPYEPGDDVGQFGLEAVYESDLIDATMVRVVLRERPGGPVRELLGESLQGGIDAVRTTIDVRVQRAVENALAGFGGTGAIVVIGTEDGAIRASASRPLTEYNRAFEGRYPPGSTFKIVTAEALLGAGLQPDSEVACPGQTVVGGLSVPNAGNLELGTTTLEQAFANSCNTTFASLAASELDAQRLTAATERFGFDVAPALPLPAFGASFPAPADTAELAAAAFGQARVEVSPLHLASVAAAARSGVWRPPYLMVDDEPGDARQLSGGVLEDLRRMLRAVVTDGNGAAANVSDEISTMEGKTGSAQAAGGLTHAWFAGSWGDYGFAVLVEDGGSGAEVAAPIAARFVDELAAQLAAAEG